MIERSNGKMAVSGSSSQIRFYSYDESSYALTNTIDVPDSEVWSFAITPNFSKLVYGYDNETFNIYTLKNENYQKEFSYDLGGIIRMVEMDESSLYYSAIAFTNLYTFYHCPTGCASCSFPNNCSQCSEGYILKGV